jgi:hypothetical protein
LEVVQLMYNAHPAAVQIVAEVGTATVLQAAIYQNDAELIDFVLDKYPDACKIADRVCRRLPFHTAVLRGHGNLTILERLYAVYPEAISTLILGGNLILHRLLLKFHVWNDITAFERSLRFLLKHHPEATIHCNDDKEHYIGGMSPFLIADELDFPDQFKRLILIAEAMLQSTQAVYLKRLLAALNYQARRGALSLLYANDINIPIVSSTMIWRLLRDCGEPGIMKTIVMLL